MPAYWQRAQGAQKLAGWLSRHTCISNRAPSRSLPSSSATSSESCSGRLLNSGGRAIRRARKHHVLIIAPNEKSILGEGSVQARGSHSEKIGAAWPAFSAAHDGSKHGSSILKYPNPVLSRDLLHDWKYLESGYLWVLKDARNRTGLFAFWLEYFRCVSLSKLSMTIIAWH